MKSLTKLESFLLKIRPAIVLDSRYESDLVQCLSDQNNSLCEVLDVGLHAEIIFFNKQEDHIEFIKNRRSFGVTYAKGIACGFPPSAVEQYSNSIIRDKVRVVYRGIKFETDTHLAASNIKWMSSRYNATAEDISSQTILTEAETELLSTFNKDDLLNKFIKKVSSTGSYTKEAVVEYKGNSLSIQKHSEFYLSIRVVRGDGLIVGRIECKDRTTTESIVACLSEFASSLAITKLRVNSDHKVTSNCLKNLSNVVSSEVTGNITAVVFEIAALESKSEDITWPV